MKRQTKIVIVTSAVLLTIILVPAALATHYIFTVRFPEQRCTGVYSGRLCIYARADSNYSGEGIYVSGSYDPYQCVADNGTYVSIGPLGSQAVYDQNGTRISIDYYTLENATWIPKKDSAIIVYDLALNSGILVIAAAFFSVLGSFIAIGLCVIARRPKGLVES